MSVFTCVVLVGCDTSRSGGRGGAGGSGGSGGDMSYVPPCTGLECQIEHNCSGGTKTTLTGKVYAPNGTLPLYNATVFVPNAPLEAFTAGVSCDRCDGSVSGNPVAIALTDATGSFTLTDVPGLMPGAPSAVEIPLVVQIGRWRRQVMIPAPTNCTTTAITSVDSTRLPRTKLEGDLPQMAIASGGSDPFECLLRKVGIADSEFTTSAKDGRVHYYLQNGIDLQGGAPAASTLWTSPTTLMKYDIVILPCEGGSKTRDAGPLANLVNYTNAGGRVFTTHYSHDWLHYSGSPFEAVGKWNDADAYPSDPLMGTLDTSFPKGMAFADWLQNVMATTTKGVMSIAQPRHDIDSVTMKAQRWISWASGILHMTFNTPINAQPDDMGIPQYCGRVVYSDFHVSASAADFSQKFPASCKAGDMSGQEKALAFMLFDLSSCVQKDSEQPIP